MIHYVRRARVAHRCDEGGDTIQPGEVYEDEVYPPWTMVGEEPDLPAAPLGRWDHIRVHPRCRAEAMYG
jgi:hypothetical protein